MITYLICDNNNKAETVLKAFKKSVESFGLPARVRGDNGSENSALAIFMRTTQGYQGAYIQGPSVHNQRIERLHYDTTHCVLSLFINLFIFMESSLILDRNNYIDIFCLHVVFLPRIQRALDEFKDGWNHHPLSTAKNKTPYQLWMEGMMNKKMEEQRGVRTYLSDESFYGIDLSDFPDCENYDDNVAFEEYNWEHEFGQTFSSVQHALNNCEQLTAHDIFGINHYVSIKNKKIEIVC